MRIAFLQDARIASDVRTAGTILVDCDDQFERQDSE
jgi:hypothetical protein